MKYYSELLAMGCFTREDLTELTGNYNTAGSLLVSYLKRGYIRGIRRNLYAAINLADNAPVVSKYRIARHITPTAYVSHHAAFEYYGSYNQVSYQVEVSSETPFRPFEFDWIRYVYIASRIREGVAEHSNGIRVTDPERTVLDGINDLEKVIGLEELLKCIELMPMLKEDKLLEYLAVYNKQVLYQKTGYILEHFQKGFRLSDTFFNECVSHIGKSTRYFTLNRRGVYDNKWKMIVPENLLAILMKGMDEDAEG